MKRCASLTRNTKETQIEATLLLDGTGKSNISTGVGFFDHMLTLFAFHSGMDLTMQAHGDLDVCDHHLVEDAGIVLGELLKTALGDKRGIARYGNARVPMDETLCSVDLDFSGRSYLVCHCDLKRDQIGSFSCEMLPEFLRAFSDHANLTLHVNVLYGENDHHKVEAVFKAFGRAVKEGIRIVNDELPSTKGVLE
ncbi:imidazoleglycerol-phosphate dehydratase HisB [Merdibacter massiliensis]|uniref:imidazoleglycerol-phosphate dehydratase HisB n=1 Tax=Merdibacter massiliensis TaxID=1871030 RepID=UPI00096A2D9D|nr:imidazoleglycerol-phosphate dehydratase HisB [Merdibacter massiliensis]